MTTITPARDAVVRACEKVKADLARRVEAGEAAASDARMTEAIMAAALFAWADEADRGVDYATILAGLEAAFANAIASTVRTVCNREGWLNTVPVFDAFMQGLFERVDRLSDERPAHVREPVRMPKEGNA